MSSTSNKTIAFFGATGGCANACLAYALNAGHHATALARTPPKLTSKLLAQGVSQTTLDTNLRIIKGDATDVAAVKSTILLGDGNDNGGSPALVASIVSGLGGTPSLETRKLIIPRFKLDNPHITEETTEALLSALRELYAQYPDLLNKPVLTVISTTGVTKQGQPKDVPLLLRPLYRTFLQLPHDDKRRMEDLVSANQDLFSGTVIVRPTLLAGDGSLTSAKGLQHVRVGTESKPALGYQITKTDVGLWIFEEVIQGDGQKWLGKKVSLTS
ncbi:hypothetical protein Egran_05322 [Elaphomyces granulatus]|uniref:NAD(P)-binding domain-containing protein n=1 Tax=Elaphomyces granulatus TaxID=519963 RepID=A0A232LS02_9EURO|nr:hypothetical protein Egran_05322 [Elaphomyces granulatus]